VVIIPEGLSLAAQIAMALSIGELKKDKILVKNVDAI
jgi:magnesium-transporting ATPase (P-type)